MRSSACTWVLMLIVGMMPVGSDLAWAERRSRPEIPDIPPPPGCQWAKKRMYYDANEPGFDCFAYGHDGTNGYIVTSVIRGNMKGEVRLGSWPFKKGAEKEWVSIRQINGQTVQARYFPPTPHQNIMLHVVNQTGGRGRVDFEFRAVDYGQLFGETLRHMGQAPNFASWLGQTMLVQEEERRAREAGRGGNRPVNIDPTTDALFKLVIPFFKEAVFGCGDTELATQQAVTGLAVNAIMKELDLGPEQRVSVTHFITSYIWAMNKLMLFDMRDMLDDKCAQQ